MRGRILYKILALFACYFIITSSSVSFSEENNGVAQSSVDDVSIQSFSIRKVGKFIIREDYPEEYGIYNLKLKRYELLDGFMIYQEDTNTYLPMSDIVYALEFPISVNATSGIVKGWFINKNREFLIDLSKGTAEVNGTTVKLDATDVHLYDSEIFIKSALLSKLFNIRFTIKDERSSVLIESDEILPVEENIIRRNAYDNFSSYERTNVLAGIKNEDVISNEENFTVPAVDFSLGFTHRKITNESSDTEEIKDSLNTSIYGGGRFLGFDNQFNYYNDTESKKDFLRFNLSEYYPDEEDKIKYLEFGDISAHKSALISNGGLGRGLQFTTFDRLKSSDKKSVDIVGSLPFGWEAELSKNGTILAFQRENKDGQYEFLDQPVNLGLNIFKITLHGPFGQKEEKEKIVYISPTAVDEGELGFKFSMLQTNKPLFDLENKDYYTDKIALETEYGITDNLSLVTGLSLKDITDKSTQSELEEEENLFLTGFKANINSNALGLYLAQGLDSKEQAIQTSFETKLLNLNLLAEYSDFGKLKTEESYLNTEHVETLTELRLGGAMNFGIKRLPFWINYREGKTVDDKKETELSGNISYNLLSKLSLTYELSERDTFSRDKESYSTIRLSANYLGADLRAEASYSNSRDELTSNNISADIDLNDTISTSFRWQHRYKTKTTSTSSDSFSASLNKMFSFGTLSFTGQVTDTDDYSIGIRYNFGLRRNPTTRKYHSFNGNVSSTSSLSANIFLDDNENGIMDEDEEKLEYVSVKLNGSERDELSDKDGNVFVPSISTYKAGLVTINEETLPDISMVPSIKNIPIRGKPGSWVEISYPVVLAGIVDGTVITKVNGRKRTQKGMKISLIKEGSEEIHELISDSDGYFSFENIRKGKYQVIFDEQQLKDLDLRVEKNQIFRVHEDNLFMTLDNIILKPGYKPQRRKLEVYKPEKTKFKNYVKGKVECPFTGCRNKIAGIRVNLIKEGILFGITKTDDYGNYKFNNVKAGEYEVRLSTPDLIIRGLRQEDDIEIELEKDIESIDQNIPVIKDLGMTAKYKKLEVFLEKDKLIKKEELKNSEESFIIGRIEKKREGEPTLPAEGIKINLYRDDEIIRETISDNMGIYSFDELDKGEYDIRLDKGQLRNLEVDLKSIGRHININSDKLYLEMPKIEI
ncbi:MAG: hypothetical protein N4A44_03380 [Alphaproteobacteria bacterium]|jgi:hypothetical protein|nr:hypothetical protein [Alphaproteobacteria bacterium]